MTLSENATASSPFSKRTTYNNIANLHRVEWILRTDSFCIRVNN